MKTNLTISTFLTLTRIALTPFIVYAMVNANWGVAFWLFITAAITDVLDGAIARFLGQETVLGAYLDPVADKILVVSCFATLAFVQPLLFVLPQWFVLLVLIKELFLLSGGAWLFFKKGLIIKATWLGKFTMFVQVCFIIWLFACYFFHWLPVKTYNAMLGLMLTLVVASLLHYTRIWLFKVIR